MSFSIVLVYPHPPHLPENKSIFTSKIVAYEYKSLLLMSKVWFGLKKGERFFQVGGYGIYMVLMLQMDPGYPNVTAVYQYFMKKSK